MKNNNSTQLNEKENQFSKINKINHNSIIDKIHSIQSSINDNKPKFARRKNNFRKGVNKSKLQETIKKSRTKSKKKISSKSKNKTITKSKKINESVDINPNKKNSINNKSNNIYNYNTSIAETNNCSNNSSNSFFVKNTTNNGLNTNNNIIITINNYNKVLSPSIDQSSKTIPNYISKDKNYNKTMNSKKIKYSNKDNNNITKKNLYKNKNDNEIKIFNYFINSHNLSLDNGVRNNIYNNNIYLNNLINNKNGKKISNNNKINENNDNISINSYNTINESNNIDSSNNNTNREFSNRILIKKNNNYQDNIMLKKKQLGMYSPKTNLKINFDISSKAEKGIKYNHNKQIKDNINSFDISERNSYHENLNIDNNKNEEKDINTKNKYNFNYNNINKNINNYNSENITNDNRKNISDNNSNNSLVISNNNKYQVNNILSKIKQIKNTKQIYNNKKIFAFNKFHRKKEKERGQLYSSNNSYFLRSRPSYSKLTDRNRFNNKFFYYSRSNSKNVFNYSNKNLNFDFLDFTQKKSSKSNQKLLDKSFMSQTDRGNKKKSTNESLLSHRKKRNKIYNYENINGSKNNNIRTEKTFNEKDSKKKFIDDIDDECLSLNNSISSNKNINNYFTTKNKNSNNDMKNIFNKNNTSNKVSMFTNIDLSSNNKIIDTYENTTLVNINNHCDSLLSKINQKIKEKENKRNRYNLDENDNQNVEINDAEKSHNNIVCKKIVSNASISRRGLNRPDEMMKINQDTLFKVKFGDLNYSYYGVCDGHGPSGHYVSDFIKSNIAFIVYKHLKSLLIANNININLSEIDDSNIDFSKLFKDCFLLMDSRLTDNKSIDIELSGTTCVSLLFCNNKIISANVGDSRAIKGQYNSKRNKWSYLALSRDHKPSEIDEAERIKKCKGIIHPYIDDDGNYAGPDRVWIDDELPGLAMSRSFGDEIARKVGVFAEPEVKIFPFLEEDKFIVIASDGLWEYVSNDEVIEIVSEYFEKKDCDGAVSKLYEISYDRWIHYDDYIDDISIIVAFLD